MTTESFMELKIMKKQQPFRTFTGFTDPNLLRGFEKIEDDERRRRGEKTKLKKALMQLQASLRMNREK